MILAYIIYGFREDPYLLNLSTVCHIISYIAFYTEGTHIGGSLYTDNVAVAAGRDSPAHSLHKSTSSLRTVAVLLCLVVVAGLGTWGVVVHRRKWKRGNEKGGIIGKAVDRGSYTGSPVHSIGSQQSVIRRK